MLAWVHTKRENSVLKIARCGTERYSCSAGKATQNGRTSTEEHRTDTN